MGVMMQAFYWDCHVSENRREKWWPHVTNQVPALARAGFTGLWLPPASKGDARLGMGYDPFDYFDLGEFDQRGDVPTGFGTRTDLEALIGEAHARNLQVYADVVYNHCSGGALEPNPDIGGEYWTRFDPASDRFPRNYACFHPSRYEAHDHHRRYGGFPDLCHRNPDVYGWLLEHARFLVEDVGFDGFRFDLVNGYGAWIVAAVLEYLYRPQDGRRNASVDGREYFRPFGCGESWSMAGDITHWLDTVDPRGDTPTAAFDFPMRYRLKDLCDRPGYSLRDLSAPGALCIDRPEQAVTFVDNHDLRGEPNPPIINDKMLAYAVILTHPGYPCVFWQDYFTYDLALPGEPSGIDALVAAHERHAGGGMIVRHAADDLYLMERTGWGDQSGLVFVLNNRGDSWHGTWIPTQRAGTYWEPVAWRGRADLNAPQGTWSGGEGWAQFWAPPRGYAVYAPRT